MGNLILLIISVAIVFYVIYVNTTNKEASGGGKVKQNAQEERTNNKYLREYSPDQASRAVLQILESTNIIASSKNIDTIMGRAEFLQERLDVLSQSSLSGWYETAVQKGLDMYKSTYYDKDIDTWQAAIVMKPRLFDFHRFYAQSLYNGFMRHYENQEKEIDNLKRESAIKNRYIKLAEVFNEFTREFVKVWDSADANKFKIDHMKELEVLSKRIKKKTS